MCGMVWLHKRKWKETQWSIANIKMHSYMAHLFFHQNGKSRCLNQNLLDPAAFIGCLINCCYVMEIISLHAAKWVSHHGNNRQVSWIYKQHFLTIKNCHYMEIIIAWPSTVLGREWLCINLHLHSSIGKLLINRAVSRWEGSWKQIRICVCTQCIIIIFFILSSAC